MEIGKLMRPKLQKHGGLKLAGRMNETQILQTQCRNICKLNSSRAAGGYNTRDYLEIIILGAKRMSGYLSP